MVDRRTAVWRYREKLKQFMSKRERGELLIQNIRRLTSNLFREVTLDIPREKQIRFGNVVQLVSPDNCKAGRLTDIALSGIVSEKEIDKVQHFSEGCELTGSTETRPCVRNCFRICSEGYDRCGETLNYGQAFILSPVESQDGPLYVEAEVPTFFSTFGISRHPVLQFTACKNFYSLWRILPLEHGKRKELEGTPVPGNTRLSSVTWPQTRTSLPRLTSGVLLFSARSYLCEF